MPQRALARHTIPAQANSSSGSVNKLDMTVSADHITADLKVRFDRKPQAKEEWDLINDMKTKYNFKWTGYAETGSWGTDKLAVVAFEDKAFRARIKCACSGLSFFGPDGKNLELGAFVEAVKTFDPDAVDDDLGSLSASKVPPSTPESSNKRPRT